MRDRARFERIASMPKMDPCTSNAVNNAAIGKSRATGTNRSQPTSVSVWMRSSLLSHPKRAAARNTTTRLSGSATNQIKPRAHHGNGPGS